MITIGMNYEVYSDKEELFVNKFKDVMDLVNTMNFHHKTRTLLFHRNLLRLGSTFDILFQLIGVLMGFY